MWHLKYSEEKNRSWNASSVSSQKSELNQAADQRFSLFRERASSLINRDSTEVLTRRAGRAVAVSHSWNLLCSPLRRHVSFCFGFVASASRITLYLAHISKLKHAFDVSSCWQRCARVRVYRLLFLFFWSARQVGPRCFSLTVRASLFLAAHG